MTVYYIGLAAMITTFIGGFFALYFKDRLHLILGYSAGAVMGVALFDLMPEAIDIGSKSQLYSVATVTSFVALGFAIYLSLDRLLSSLGSGANTHDHDHDHDIVHANSFAIWSLILHSLLDGLTIGFAFQISSQVGIILAIAVLMHDFSDGINTVSLSLLKDKNNRNAKKWLLIDSIAPMLGVVLSQFVTIGDRVFAPLLAVFAGFFLYIGASDLIPESQHRHPHFWTSFMTILGMLTLYIVINSIGF